MLRIRVTINGNVAAREPASIDQAGVVQLVGDDQIAFSRERGEYADICLVPGVKRQRRLALLPAGQAALEVLESRVVAGDEPRGPRAATVAARVDGGRLRQNWRRRQAQIII